MRRLGAFFGFGDAPALLGPRWLVLRGGGLVYMVIFAGILFEGRALVGAHGIDPIADFCTMMQEVFPHLPERFLRAPGLFCFIGAGPVTLAVLPWVGMAAAVGLFLNLWPRLCLFVCWLIFISYVSSWRIFTASIDDQLMLEFALLAIPFAPAGFRPGLGATSPPPPITVFALRFLLFRVMFESGIIKLIPANSPWRDFTAMNVLFQSSPAPTVLGYFNSCLPHAFLVAQIVLTFVAEIIAPIAAVFGGRRWRWFAFLSWTIFQAGIQATINFGWLNTASIVLGLLLLDDTMLAQAATGFRLALFRAGPVVTVSAPVRSSWRQYFLQVAIVLHAAVSVYFFVAAAANRTETGVPKIAVHPVDFLFRDFRSANFYIPFASFPNPKYEVEFAGSNNGGETWLPYEYRFKPQHEDRMSPFFAPWFSRFEASLQLAVYAKPAHVAKAGRQILLGNADVIALFRDNPFPDRPPTELRMMVFKFSFVDWATHRTTGRYWDKEFVGDLLPPLQLDADGHLLQPSLDPR